MSARSICLLSVALLIACENAEERTRYVKEPLESAETMDRATLSAAVQESKTRLVTVRNRQLRAEISNDIDETYSRNIAVIEEADKREAARIAEEAERRRVEERRGAERAEAAEQERKLEAERRKALEASSRTRGDDGEDSSDQASRREAAEAEQRTRAKDAATALEVHARNSALGDGTKVLVMQNVKPWPAYFDLRCFTVADRFSKTFAMAVPAGGEKHLGFLQGWCSNFKSGERCEAYVEGELMWKYTIP